jgi:hypothetical protein
MTHMADDKGIIQTADYYGWARGCEGTQPSWAFTLHTHHVYGDGQKAVETWKN